MEGGSNFGWSNSPCDESLKAICHIDEIIQSDEVIVEGEPSFDTSVDQWTTDDVKLCHVECIK